MTPTPRPRGAYDLLGARMNVNAPHVTDNIQPTPLHHHMHSIKIIITKHVYPPIPDRSQDWCAYYDGEEELGHYGWGPTEEAAIVNLQEHYDPEPTDLPFFKPDPPYCPPPATYDTREEKRMDLEDPQP